MKKVISLAFLFLIIIIIRIAIDKLDIIVYLIAAVNWISLIIIVACILENVSQGIHNAYASRPKSVAQKRIKRIMTRYCVITSITFILLIIIYFWLLCSTLANDILSIITVGIAVLDEEIIKLFLNFYKDGKE